MNQRAVYPEDSTWWQNRILRVLVGSGAYGTSLDAVADRDELAITLEPAEYVTGTQRFDSTLWRPGRATNEPSQPGDLDLSIYGARKFAALAMKGNPSILGMLFAPVLDINVPGVELRANTAWFHHRGVAGQFIGYMKAQRDKLEGVRGGTHGPFRTDLIEAHGYDTKFAGHVIRLGLQGVEFLATGRMQLPMAEPQRTLLLAVRRGEWALADVLQLADQLLADLRSAEKDADIPTGPNVAAIDRWLHRSYQWQWDGRA